MSRTLVPCALLASLLLQAALASAADRGSHDNVGKDRLAVQGYDVVAYFVEAKPVAGNPQLTAEHAGNLYRFASEEHRRLFKQDPEKYLPQYGGWCATAMAYGRKVEIAPTNFKITDGKLYLFYKSFLTDAIKEWNTDEKANILKADASWKKLTSG